jgi:putative ABC transport system substrate-binding protein
MPVRSSFAIRILVAILILVIGVFVFVQTHNAPSRPHRIGLLLSGSYVNQAASIAMFDQAMRNLGYVEGENIVVERRAGEGRDDRLSEAARELAQMNLDLIVAFGPSAARAAIQATSSTPIVMGNHDAVEQGLVASLNRPGGNVTGWSLRSSESGAKQLQYLKEAFPHVSRVAVLFNPAMPGQGPLVQSLTDKSKELGVELFPLGVANADQLAATFSTMRDEKIEGLFVIADPSVIDGLRDRIIALAAEHRIPAMYPLRMYADAGGLMSYGPSISDLVGRHASFVDRILKGAKPADIPIESPDKYELILNDRTAQALGITFPKALRAYAQETLK